MPSSHGRNAGWLRDFYVAYDVFRVALVHSVESEIHPSDPARAKMQIRASRARRRRSRTMPRVSMTLGIALRDRSPNIQTTSRMANADTPNRPELSAFVIALEITQEPLDYERNAPSRSECLSFCLRETLHRTTIGDFAPISSSIHPRCPNDRLERVI